MEQGVVRPLFETGIRVGHRSRGFGDVPLGVFVVACVADQKFVAVRTIKIAADAAPFTIEYNPIRMVKRFGIDEAPLSRYRRVLDG